VAFTGTILALDTGSNTGWAYGSVGERPRFGAKRFGNADSSVEYRWHLAHEWMCGVCEKGKPDVYVYEEPTPEFFHAGKTNHHTQVFLKGLVGVFGAAAYSRVPRKVSAEVHKVRYHFIQENPKRKIAKKKTILKCRELGWETDDDENVADALALWSYTRAMLCPELAVATTPLFANPARQTEDA
jgi:hypothetical protein